MHSFTKKSTCFLMTAIAAAIASSPIIAQAENPILLTAPPAAQTSPAQTAPALLPVPNGPSSQGLDISPPGANLSNCVPSKVHPYPVILLSGLGGSMNDDYSKLSPILANAGYCVYATNYGVTPPSGVFGFKYGMAPLMQSYNELVKLGQKFVQQTGAKKVQIVGHSEGGLAALALTKGDTNNVVDTVVALAPATRGTTFGGLVPEVQSKLGNDLAKLIGILGGNLLDGPAAADLLSNSDVITKWLNDYKGATPKTGVNYTVIATEKDTVVTPYTSQFLDAGPLVNNIDLQKDYCSTDTVDHGSLSYDNAVIQLTLNALGGDVNGNKKTPNCNNSLGAWPGQ